MFVDASALTAMILEEGGFPDLIERVERRRVKLTSPMAIWETAVAVARVVGLPIQLAQTRTTEYLSLLGIDLVPVPSETAALALEAFDRYGKGRHPASLNFGDCFAYACARHYRQPLLYKGGDFALTDIEPA